MRSRRVYRGRKVGAISDVTCFSLYATKNVAAGEGGIVATDRDDVAEAIDDLRIMRRGHGSLYDIAVPGYKANLSDVLAAIALVQLDKLDRHRAIRERHFELYDAARRRAGRDRAARPRPARRPRAPPLRRPDRRRPAPAARATSTSGGSASSGSRPASTSCPCTG